MHELFINLMAWLDDFKTDLLETISGAQGDTQDAIEELHEQLQWDDPEQEAE